MGRACLVHPADRTWSLGRRQPLLTTVGIGTAARSLPDAAALVSLRRSITFGDLDDRQRRLAGAFAEGGLARGDRIGIRARNDVGYLEVTIAALRAGIVPVPIGTLLAPPEVSYILRDAQARWLFTDAEIDDPGLDRVITFGDAYERLIFDSTPRDIADHMLTRPMHYTSGTTGDPKGVWVPPAAAEMAAESSARFIEEWWLSTDDIHLVCSPLSHSAPHRFAARTLEAGGTVLVMERFDPREFLAAVEFFSITTTFLVPTHLERIMALRRDALARHDLSSLRMVVHAGAPVREATKKKAIALFPEGSLWEFYGATEGYGTRISTPEWIAHQGSVGTARPGARIVVTDDAGQEADERETGTVWIDDPAAERFVYWRDPARTREAWRHGRFTVGDIGYLEDGYLYLEGRSGDMIITGGVNVYPHEVESVLASHPSVQECMVYGLPDEEWGQVVTAAVVARFAQPLDPDLLRIWARERLSGARVPKVIEVVDELPRSPAGKLLRPR